METRCSGAWRISCHQMLGWSTLPTTDMTLDTGYWIHTRHWISAAQIFINNSSSSLVSRQMGVSPRLVVARSGEMRAARNYLSSSTLVCYDAQIKSNDTRTHLVRYLTFTAEGSKTEKRKCLQRSLRTFLYVLCVLFLKCDIVHRCHNNKHNDIRNNVKEISSSLWTHVTIVSSSQHVSRIVAPVNGNRRVT